MEYYNRQPATFEKSTKPQEEICDTNSHENLDINYDKDIAEVQFTVESMRAVTELFLNKVDILLQESCEEVDNCL